MMYYDISLEISDELVSYSGNPKNSVNRVQNIDTGDRCNVMSISMGTHSGTHIDAPSHFIKNGQSVAEIPFERINGKALVIDCGQNDTISVPILELYGIQEGDIVLFKTRNSEIFNGKKLMEQYVTLEYDAAEYLAEKKISMVGIDYLTVEVPRKFRKSGISNHDILLGRGIYIIEGINMKKIDEGEYFLVCMPLKIKNGDGSPVRAVLYKDI